MTVKPDLALAAELFAALDRRTRVGRGIVRDTYGDGEGAAHALARAAAARIGLEVATDAACNLYMTLPGADRRLPRLVVGSHLDSVPQGGNYDGAAGVVAGLAAVAGLRAAGVIPARDVTVMAIRGEEAAWFDWAYIGAHAAFGRLPAAALATPRADDGRPLAEHMAAAGCDLTALRCGDAHLQPGGIAAFLEVHIEQGPVLEARGLPVGLVTGIRGCLRHAAARCTGVYAHSGATPRAIRRDAVAATVALLAGLDDHWTAAEAAGEDLVFTVGQLATDPALAGPSKVAGETRFSLDFRGLQEATMRAAAQAARNLADAIEARHGVRFDLGEPSYSYPAATDPGLRRRLAGLAAAQGLPVAELASGAGHDAAVFATFGVPTAMIFIRNRNGSHNPDEAMDLPDFAAAAALLAGFIVGDAAATG